MSISHEAEVLTFPKPRLAVAGVAPYAPPLEGRREKTRLDFNENTLGFPHIVPNGYDIETYNCYPEYQAFIDDLAQYLGVPADCVMLSNGSDEALDVIPRTFIEPKVGSALITEPSFYMIRHNLCLAEAELDVVSLTDRFEYPLDVLTQKLAQKAYTLAIFATPDNPTGAVLPKEVALNWAKQHPETLFVLDEAYAFYRPEEDSALREVVHTPNVLVTQTFSKAWGLAGLRLGYIVGHPTLLGYLKRVRSPYSVNAQAVAMAHQLLGDAPLVKRATEDTLYRRETLMNTLIDKGYRVQAGPTNFFLLHLGLQASNFVAFASRLGILVRDQSKQPLLKGWIRISTGSEGENLQFLDVLNVFTRMSALVFDLDDTLVDTSQSFDKVVAYMVNKNSEVPLGIKELNTLRAEGGFNDDWDAIAELLRRRNVHLDRDEIQAQGSAIYHQLAKQSEKALLNLDDIKALGTRYRLFIFTGREQSEYDDVWGEAMNPLFEAVYCSDAVEGLRRKPFGDYLQHIQRTHCLERAWYIGNSVDDMKSAKAAGYFALGVCTTFTAEQLRAAGADAIIESPTDLKELFAC
jgi:histidinol-phosphate aminotransferase